ncbi:hypothetical protein Poly21_04490 [Allorhodopirellula heiligendammensis]|uniref:Uncharacterized protein n=2 Tax=Allorhodopirellula heiligendammensis TaxID=2714739 RepID=A0A5C6C2D1_9BACT|nr:hypothetical protein Poly21_04490 [Allorhodopirellula heiligendammensis]
MPKTRDEDHDDHPMLLRSESHLDALSVEMKWETTRRQPLYFVLWNTWRALQKNHESEAESLFLNSPLCHGAGIMLGINGIPSDPALEPKELFDTDTNLLWLKRSARPVTFGLLARMLGTKLSSSDLKTLSGMLLDAAESEAGSMERDQKLSSFTGLKCPDLDVLVDLPLLLYNPSAPSKEFVSDITNLRSAMRSKLGIEDSRTSETKMRSYLAAWDTREGWRDGVYDRLAPMTLKDVARELGTSDRNAKYAYQQGFQLISGHPFSFSNWMRLMGVLHLSGYLGRDVNSVSLSRLRHASSVRGTDDTTLSSSQQNPGTSVLENFPSNEDGFNVTSAIEQIRDMIRSGRENDQILAELELEEDAEPAINELRSIIEMEGG